MGSPQSAASAEQARFNAQEANQLANIALPQLQSALKGITSDFTTNPDGTPGIPKSVQSQYGQIAANVNTDYGMIGAGDRALIQQTAKQSGQPYTTNMTADRMTNLASTLEAQRRQAQNEVSYDEAAAGMTQYNALLSDLGIGSGQALQLAGGWSSGASGALQYLPQTSPGSGALSGALAGAAAGTAAYPGIGTLVGAGVGALGGYLSAGG